MEISEEQYVLMRGKCFLGRQKAPFVPSGYSFAGSLEWDQTADRIRCHECGEWFSNLGKHIGPAHRMTAREYKLKHSIQLKTPLWTPSCTARMSVRIKTLLEKRSDRGGPLSDPAVLARAIAARKASSRVASARLQMEQRNEKRHCPAQILYDVRELAEKLGRTPSKSEIESSGISLKSACLALNIRNSVAELVRLSGLLPHVKGPIPGKQSRHGWYTFYTVPLLCEFLRDFYAAHQRLPVRHDHNMGLLPGPRAFKRVFGSMRAAFEAAGLGGIEPTPRKTKYTKETLAQALREFYSENDRMPREKDFGSKGLPGSNIFCYYFGTMAEAYRSSGLESKVPKPWLSRGRAQKRSLRQLEQVPA